MQRGETCRTGGRRRREEYLSPVPVSLIPLFFPYTITVLYYTSPTTLPV